MKVRWGYVMGVEMEVEGGGVVEKRGEISEVNWKNGVVV